MDSSSSVYTGYVNLSDTSQLVSKSDLDQSSISILEDALRNGGTKLKSVIRTLPLHPGDPARKQLWPRMIAVQYEQPLTSLLISGTVDPGTQNFRLLMSDEQLTPTYYLNEAGKLSVKRVLHVLGQQNPTLVTAPHVFPLAALMLHYMSERETLACLETLLSQPNVIIQVSDTWKKHCHAMNCLSSRYAKKFHKYSTQQSEPAGDMTHWSHAIWNLPFPYVLRIVDCFFIEGVKVLYRAGLVLWKETYRLYLRSISLQPITDMHTYLTEFSNYLATSKDYSPQIYLHNMFRIRNFQSKIIQSKLDSFDPKGCDDCKNCIKLKPLGQSPGYIAFSLHDESPSSILSKENVIAILERLDDHRLSQIMKPHLVFSTAKDGTSLKTFLQYSSEVEENVLIIRTIDGDIFGAFLADRWAIQANPRYYGRGASFLFSMKQDRLVFYNWVKNSKDVLCNMFQKIGHDHIQIGGGENGAAISIDANLDKGASYPSSTFGSPLLSSSQQFRIETLELLAFRESQ